MAKQKSVEKTKRENSALESHIPTEKQRAASTLNYQANNIRVI